jgi:phosphatidylserine decarboxylase
MIRALAYRLGRHEDVNFWLTNRIPRRLLTRFVGWVSRIEHPWVRDASIALWRLFADLDLADAADTHYPSLRSVFVRKLKPGARPISTDAGVLTSPSDAILGAHGRIENGTVVQAKGFGYTLDELLLDRELSARHLNGTYATLRLTAGMYHRFHAPEDCYVDNVTYISGDVWNVNPIALRRIDKLFCKNERAVLRMRIAGTREPLTLVPVGAILVASIRLHFIDVCFHLQYRGPHVIPCDVRFAKGDEMGWFEHGSTIIVLAPRGYELVEGLDDGATLRMGQPLMRKSSATQTRSSRRP